MAFPQPFFRLWHVIADPDCDGDAGTINTPLRHREGTRRRVHRLCQQSTSREEFVATVIVPSPCDKKEVRFLLMNKETSKSVSGQLQKRRRNPHLACDELVNRGIPAIYRTLCTRGAMIPYEFSLVLLSRNLDTPHTIELRVRRCKIRIPSPPFYFSVEGSGFGFVVLPVPSVDPGQDQHSNPDPGSGESPSLPMPALPETPSHDHVSLREQLLQEYSSRTENTKVLYEKAMERNTRTVNSLPDPTRALDWRNVTPDAPLLCILTGFSIETFNYVCSLTRDAVDVMHKNTTLTVEDIILMISTYLRHYKPIKIMANEYGISRTSFQSTVSKKMTIIADALESKYLSEKLPSGFPRHYLATVLFLGTEKTKSLRAHEMQLGVSSLDPIRNQTGVKFACVFDWEGHIRFVSIMYLGETPDAVVLDNVSHAIDNTHIFNASNTSHVTDTDLTQCHDQGGCIVTADDLSEAIDRCQKFVRQTCESWRCLVDRFRGRLSNLNTIIRLCYILQWHQTT